MIYHSNNHLPSVDLIDNYIISGNLITITAYMVKTFVVSKDSINFELFVDGTIEVKPLPHENFSFATIEVLASAHRVTLQRTTMERKKEEFVELAINYFENKGFKIKEI